MTKLNVLTSSFMHFSKTYRFKDFCDGALSFSLTLGNCPEFGK